MPSNLSDLPRAPVALFVYNRPQHTRRTVEALQANYLAEQTPFYVFVDGARDEAARADNEAVLAYVKTITGFASVAVVQRERNFGLAGSIVDGVSSLCRKYGRVIVLEDDLLTSPHFLTYMNDALDMHANDERVGSISAYMYPLHLRPGRAETIFLDFPMSWGWGTWSRAWVLFESDGAKLMAQLQERGLAEKFDRIGPGNFMKMLRDQVNGRNNSWFIRWHASLFMEGKHSLAPIRSLVNNIGLDGTGVHCNAWTFDPFQVEPSATPVRVNKRPAYKDKAFDAALRVFFRKFIMLRYLNALYRVIMKIRPYLRGGGRKQ